MKVLLTGATGFVGSHILDVLCTRKIPVRLLLRPTSDRRFIQPHLATVEVCTGSINDPESLKPAVKNVTHVIHCAGCTKARTNGEFYEINQVGTRNVVSAVNEREPKVERFVHISSLAVSGPAPGSRPVREEDPPNPISEYGKSKSAAEVEVRTNCRVPFTIIRPPAVYGPRDNGFLPMFAAISRHVLPRPSATQMLSLVYAPDLAEAVVQALERPVAVGKTYFAASPEVVTARQMADEIAARLGRWTVPLPMPPVVLWPVCLGQELISRVTGKAMLLNLQKYAELRAPGWVCDPSLMRNELGCECRTGLNSGVAATLEWYLGHHWVK